MSSHSLVAVAVQVGSLAALAGGVGFLVAVVYRWWGRERVPEGIALLLGLTAVALVLNTEQTLKQVLDSGGGGGFDEWEAARTVTTFTASAIVADLGRRVGDRGAARAFAEGATARFDRDLARVVRAGGRVLSVTLPDEVDDIDGYDPVPAETKAAFAGERFVFPRRVTVGELEDRIRARLEDDYGVGYVDVAVTAEGDVTYLAVGAREAGIGPTLAPGAAAVAVQADPANAASAGDVVQVWTTGADGEPARVANAEVRAAVDDVVTLVLDDDDAAALADDVAYRLATLPSAPAVDREFAALLRAADETMGAVVVDADSPLQGSVVGALDVTVAAIRRPDRGVTPIPARDTPIEVGATLYVVARPDALRAFESAAQVDADSSGNAGVDADDD
ncbi:TrkA C-terminal domain-containing protein [Halorubellus sp. PRR65]|uniref:TrkA C-terminal domain-containing protein n=1 Tax=Halorubellus sp. PRR65 TaxID=3098148 RepID=UPI002B2605B1|nr:TrkA C-terminal domain-containing protein [Halorubellus sp. PRR65]